MRSTAVFAAGVSRLTKYHPRPIMPPAASVNETIMAQSGEGRERLCLDGVREQWQHADPDLEGRYLDPCDRNKQVSDHTSAQRKSPEDQLADKASKRAKFVIWYLFASSAWSKDLIVRSSDVASQL